MMYYLFIPFVLLFSSSSMAIQRDVEPDMIDSAWIKVLDKEKKQKKTCKSAPNYIKKMQCWDGVHASFVQKGNYRGTQEYIFKRYSNLNKDDLKKLLNQYAVFEKKARKRFEIPRSLGKVEYHHGELHARIIRTEISALKHLLSDKTPKKCIVKLEDYYNYLAGDKSLCKKGL